VIRITIHYTQWSGSQSTTPSDQDHNPLHPVIRITIHYTQWSGWQSTTPSDQDYNLPHPVIRITIHYTQWSGLQSTTPSDQDHNPSHPVIRMTKVSAWCFSHKKLLAPWGQCIWFQMATLCADIEIEKVCLMMLVMPTEDNRCLTGWMT